MKNTENQKPTETDKSVVVSRSVSFRRSYRKPIKVITAAVCLLAALVLVSGLYVHIRNDREKINPSKLAALLKTNDCSDSAIKSVSAEKPNPNQIKYSIWLLGYRASCFSQKAEYQKAVDAYTQLKSYYAMDNDTGMVDLVSSEISADQYSISHPIHVVQARPDADPAVAKALQQADKSKK